MIKPDGYLEIGRILNAIEEEGFTISNLKMARMTQQDAEKFYADHKGKPYFKDIVAHICSDLVVGL